ncbi:MAG: hypothetical protein LBQ90_07730 [Synergistaceae bacterium]|jgi:hypothetical protein|nr:hypothetical protein [Synergistaceae bacterium]
MTKRRDVHMKNNCPITDEEWEKLRGFPFDIQRFIEDIRSFDSIRHIVAASSIAEDVYDKRKRIEALAERVFNDGCRDCAEELFLESAYFNDLMIDLEEWILNTRKALRSLNKLRPENIRFPDGSRLDTNDQNDDDVYGNETGDENFKS